MNTAVKALQPYRQEFIKFQDSVSSLYSADFGDGSGSDLCGPQSYEVFEVISGENVSVPFLYEIDGDLRLILETDLDSDAGLHNMVLVVTQLDYGQVYEQPFLAEIYNCLIEGMTVTPPTVTSFDYDLLDVPVALDVFYPDIAVTPDYCAYGFIFTATLQGTDTEPPFLTVKNDRLEVLSGDPAHRGTWTVDLMIEPNGPNTVTPQTFTYTFVISACPLDEITVTTAFPDFTLYYITDTKETLSATVSHSFAECPFQIHLT